MRPKHRTSLLSEAMMVLASQRCRGTIMFCPFSCGAGKATVRVMRLATKISNEFGVLSGQMSEVDKDEAAKLSAEVVRTKSVVKQQQTTKKITQAEERREE